MEAIVCREKEAKECSFEMQLLVVVTGCAAYDSGLQVFFRKVADLPACCPARGAIDQMVEPLVTFFINTPL